MASLDWHLGRADGVTFVELSVTSETDTRVEIESTLRPVWPPRAGGYPVAGWEGDSFTGTVEAGERLVLGYASPAERETPPATVVETGPPSGETGEDAEQLVQRLGRAAPPRDVVPLPEAGSVSGGRANDGADTPEARTGVSNRTVESPTDGLASPEGRFDGGSDRGLEARSTDCRAAGDSHDGLTPPAEGKDRESDDGRVDERANEGVRGSPPDDVASWLAEVEERLETARRLEEAESVAEARRELRSVGGIDAVRALDRELAADSRRFEGLADRWRSAEAGLESVTVPVSELERLA